MDVVDDASDYEMNFNDVPTAATDTDGTQRRSGDASAETSYVEGVKQQVAQNVTSYIWQSGRQQAKKAFNIYGNIDILRPYFDVEPHEVRARLVQSLVPSRPGANKQIKVHRELYGPTMLIFTMIALLLFQMKTSGHSVEEGTLMGTAFGVCFGYWFGVSGLMWFLSYVCNTHITILQLLSLIGYALFGHCVVVGLTTIVHTTHDHMFFYLMWAIFGGLSTLKMVAVLTSRTTGQTQKLIVCGSIAFLHLCFLLYLHFAYHQIVEDLSEMLDSSIKHVSPAVEHQAKESVHNVVERSVNQVTDALGPDQMALGHGPDTAQKLHQADNMEKVANVVTQKVSQSIQGVVRNVLPTKVPNLGIDEAAKVVKDVASNSSVVKEAVNSAGKIMQNVAQNLNKTAMNGNFMQNMAHNLTKTALNRTKFF